MACSASSWREDAESWSCSALSSLRCVVFSAFAFLLLLTCNRSIACYSFPQPWNVLFILCSRRCGSVSM